MRPIIIAATLLLMQPACLAQGPRLLSGSVSEERVAQLSSQINWHTSLSQALQDAQRQNKLVVWVHMLGKIDGAT